MKKNNNKSEMNILYTTDSKYWKYLYISILSLIINNKDDIINIYIITDHSNKSFNNNVSYLKSINSKIKIQIVKCSKNAFREFPLNFHFTLANYYRLLVGSLLPKNIDKVLYLDCDIIINSNIRELYNFVLEEDIIVGAVNEYPQHSIERLKLPKGTEYFNSGVLLINLTSWRNENFEQKAFDYINANYELIRLVDQDVLNALLFNKRLKLGEKYNYQESHFMSGLSIKPTIIHFTGSKKPWHFLSKHPYKKIFWQYFNLSPYSKLEHVLELPKDYFAFLLRKIFNKKKTYS